MAKKIAAKPKDPKWVEICENVDMIPGFRWITVIFLVGYDFSHDNFFRGICRILPGGGISSIAKKLKKL